MKKVLLILLFATGLFASNALEDAQQLGAETNYAVALTKAQKSNKVLVMVIVKENCRWCERLVGKTLSNEKVKKELQNYVTLIVDRHAKYPNIFKEDFFPSISYIDPKSEKSIYTQVGYLDVNAFMDNLKEVSKTRELLF